MDITVGTKDSHFTLNGEKTVLKMRDGFKLLAWINQHYKGSPQNDEPLSKADRWLERVASQGFHGVRVFGETESWDSKWFGKYPHNKDVWDLNMLRRGERPTSLTGLNGKMIRKFVELLKKHGLVAEYVVDATLKHTDGVCAASISQCIRQTAHFIRELEKELGSVNMFMELHNEWDAHNKANLTMHELTMQFIRTRRQESDGSYRQWPEGVVGVSHGGRDTIDYPVGRPDGADYVAIHPERSGDWWELPDLGPLKRHGVPVYFNESICYVDSKDWGEYIQQNQWFRPTACTFDLDKYLGFMQAALDAGVSFCVHDFEGMASDPDLEWTKLEYALGEPGPSPVSVSNAIERAVTLGYQQLLGREPDTAGKAHYVSEMQSGTTEAQFREQLIRSQEGLGVV